MQRRTTKGRRSRDVDTARPTARRPRAAELVALVNGVTASVGGTYVLTSSVEVTVCGGLLATVVAGVYVVFGR
ncbi:hypothetical protein [Streptomyces crystallinus]|uniref:Uncharacterized protein n=1 Tax=Streptomyces crystallinus TaxID=68191 RepID=A0ABP3QU47_9ACTN